MMEWFAMGGYAQFVWPSYAVYLLSVLGAWAWAVWRGRRIRQRIRQYLSEQSS